MTQIQKALGLFLSECAKAAGRLTDEQIESLLSGDVRVSFAMRNGKPSRKKMQRAAIEFREDFSDVRVRLKSASSREQCAYLVDYNFPEKLDLLAFAKFLRLPAQKKDGKARIRDMIVEATAGARLDSEAIRGGY